MQTMQHLEPAQPSRFPNAGLIHFSRGIRHECEQTEGFDPAFYRELNAAAEDLASKFALSPERFGENPKEIDQTNDANFKGALAQLKLNVRHPNPARANAANRILSAVEALSPAKSKDGVSGFTTYVAAFEAFSAEDLALAMVDEWLLALKEGCDAYAAFQNNNEQDESPLDLAEARARFLTAYQIFTEHLEATLLLHPDARLQDLFDRINNFIRSTKQPAAKKKKKSDADA